MQLGITPSLHYVRTYSTVVREVLPVNGQPEKHRWWLKPTKQRVEDIVDKQRCDTCTCYECDCDECTCECHEEVVKHNLLVNSTDYESPLFRDTIRIAERGND